MPNFPVEKNTKRSATHGSTPILTLSVFHAPNRRRRGRGEEEVPRGKRLKKLLPFFFSFFLPISCCVAASLHDRRLTSSARPWNEHRTREANEPKKEPAPPFPLRIAGIRFTFFRILPTTKRCTTTSPFLPSSRHLLPSSPFPLFPRLLLHLGIPTAPSSFSLFQNRPLSSRPSGASRQTVLSCATKNDFTIYAKCNKSRFLGIPEQKNHRSSSSSASYVCCTESLTHNRRRSSSYRTTKPGKRYWFPSSSSSFFCWFCCL